ncbi:unnamed protein product [Paramecium octaurelia]|uniref:Uncharacterized protein n=1 Tax=Paramecium octaurelia TaxID=43137 RepID=A0A8S1SAD9_PAROT|nr:unnamed protein product [Paramecium octaurelia]
MIQKQRLRINEEIDTLCCKLNSNQPESKNLIKTFLNQRQEILVNIEKVNCIYSLFFEIEFLAPLGNFKFTNTGWYHLPTLVRLGFLGSTAQYQSLSVYGMLRQDYKSQIRMVIIVTVNFSPDEMINRSVDGMLGQEKKKPRQKVIQMEFYQSISPHGNTLASCSYDKSIRFWNVKTIQEVLTQDTFYKDLLSQIKMHLQSPSIQYNTNFSKSHFGNLRNFNIERRNS